VRRRTGRVTSHRHASCLRLLPRSRRRHHRLPNRTAEIAGRDKRAQPGSWTPKPAVSGSDSPDLNRQNPAESREYLGSSPDASEESLLTQTQWRWGEERGNWSQWPLPGNPNRTGLPAGGGSQGRTRLLGQFPEPQGKYREIFGKLAVLAVPAPRIPSPSDELATNSLRPRTGN